MLAEDLHGHRALASNHVRIVKRMHERQVALFLQFDGMRIRVAIRFTHLHHFDCRAAVRSHRVHLYLRGRHRYHDNGFHAHARCRQGHTLCVIARRSGNHAAFQRFCRNMRHLVVGAAHLEREHRLVVFALQVNRIAQPCRQVRRMFELGLAGDVIDACGEGFLQVVVGSHASGAVRFVRRERTMIAPTARALDSTERPTFEEGSRPTVRSNNSGLTVWNILPLLAVWKPRCKGIRASTRGLILR